jgi:hypothetical protein
MPIKQNAGRKLKKDGTKKKPRKDKGKKSTNPWILHLKPYIEKAKKAGKVDLKKVIAEAKKTYKSVSKK